MNILKRTNLTLFFLALIFAMPGLAAYLFYTHPFWLNAHSTNKGKLLNPPILLNALSSKAKWGLVLWHEGPCTNPCKQQLDKLGRIRLALGRHLYEVDQWLVTNEASDLANLLASQDIRVLSLTDEQRKQQAGLSKKSAVFIVNPHNYLVLAYALDANPQDIFHDLKQLLNSTENKSNQHNANK